MFPIHEIKSHFFYVTKGIAESIAVKNMSMGVDFLRKHPLFDIL